jgi:hypothetical protein
MLSAKTIRDKSYNLSKRLNSVAGGLIGYESIFALISITSLSSISKLIAVLLIKASSSFEIIPSARAIFIIAAK